MKPTWWRRLIAWLRHLEGERVSSRWLTESRYHRTGDDL